MTDDEDGRQMRIPPPIRCRDYFGGSAPGCASSIGKVVAPAGVAVPFVVGAGAGAPASGATFALLGPEPATVERPVLFRMARSKRLADSASVLTRRAMMSAAGAGLP